MQLYVHPSDPEFLGFHEGSIFSDATVRNLLPAGNYYFSYELVEGVRSLLAAALDGMAPSPSSITPSTSTACHLHVCAWDASCADTQGIAIADRLNQRFVILCESCVPLYLPALTYMQVMREAKSRVSTDGSLDTE